MKKCDAYPGQVADRAAGPAKGAAGTTLGRGVLHQQAAASQFGLTRHEPSAALAPFVDFYWILRWDLRGRPVGASPKWVMRRARLQEAAMRAEHGGHVDWAALAADLDCADQAHLTCDFTATIGVPPARCVTFAATTPQIPEPKP